MRQAGASAVEFALIAPLLLTVLIGITSLGHLLFTINLTSEATRAGARMAVVCDINANTIRTRIEARVPQLSLTNAQVSLQYLPGGCDRNTCQSVVLSLTGVTYTPWSWILPTGIPMPAFTASLPRESLQSVSPAGETNPLCT